MSPDKVTGKWFVIPESSRPARIGALGPAPRASRPRGWARQSGGGAGPRPQRGK